MSDSLTIHLKRTLVLGLPLVGSQVAQILIGLTDTLMLGRYSVEALAASTISTSFFFTLFVLGSGFAVACMPMAADALGRDDEVQVRRVVRMGLWLSLATGVAMAPAMFWAEPIMLALGQTPEVSANAQLYLRVAGLGMIPALLTATLRSHLSALERTRIVLVATLAGAGLNVGLNWLLIFGNWGFPEMGLRGAAAASVSVHVLTVLVLLAYAMRGPDMARFELLRNIHRPDWPIFGDIFRLGWPIGLTHVSESGLFAGSALMMGWLGTVPLAAHGIAIGIAALTFMVHLGLSQAATVRVGRAWGQGDPVALRRAALAATILSGVAVLGALWLYLGAGEMVVGVFLDRTDPQADLILALGVQLLVVAALFQLVDAGQVMALGFLRGVQDTRRPMIYAIVSYWVFGLPAGYVLGFPMGLGPEGVWLGLVVGLLAATIALAARFLRITSRS
ncbi:MATE family efflux transporter [Jannaschia pohangensis]|uniref:Multidrug-efflux transporter n=1 Tax=Jannaschia pohangensis TaxID=390807 RepID=A0A1I3S7Y3_9RHOB|nr:MATE family efflux transporter [Jannaschia pohangensis]SFJ54798.1 multidrug resistance protein, MATE family [Jannaschia pohangensis]